MLLLLLLLLLQWQVLLSLCFLMLCFLRRMLQEEAPESTARTWHAAAALFSPRSVYHIHDKTTASEALALELTMGSHNKLALPDMALGSSSLTDNVEGTHVEEDEADYTSSSSSSSSMHVEEEARPADGSSCIARELPSVQIEDEKGPDCAVLEQAKLPSSHYKGVVPQPNGRWGAQIYEKHQRVWLGTFNMEHDAAKAYDRAALKFRGRDAMTNFKPAGEEDIETAFLRSHAKEQVVDMLRRHTYDEELDQTKKLAAMTGDVRSVAMISARRGASEQAAPKEAMANKAGGSRCDLQRELLFEKAVTPSDVGKLNRLVIPKQHAERCFPLSGDGSEKGLLLNFEDFTGKMWRFRYSYWNSSQSYVLTKGWSRFVKEMKLDAGDIVVFEKGSDDQLHISCRRRPSAQHALLDVTLLNLHHPAAAAAGLQRAMASPSPPWQYLPYHHHPSWQLPQQLDQCRPHQNMQQQQQQPWQPQISAPASPWLQLPHSAKQPPDNNNSAVSLAMVNSDSSKEGVRPHGLRLFGVNLSPCKEDFEPSMASGCSEEVKRKRSNLIPNDSMSQNDDRKLDKAKRFKEEGPSDLQA